MTTLSILTCKKLDPALITKFVAAVRSRLGIVVQSHQINELCKIIIIACEKFNCSPEQYLDLINTGSNQSPYLNHLVSGITVGETYFFRDKKQMDLLKNEILPKIIQDKRNQYNLSIRIWSAGCASGEEIYTIAMLLNELIPDLQDWTIKLLATDINTNALRKALIGNYTEWSMRSIPTHFKEKYFKKNNKNYILSKKIREMVTFDFLNLNDDSYPSIFNGTNSQDLILCRNVLIYFDNESIKQLMQRLNHCLLVGGYLLLGASDPINIAATDLIFNHQHGLLFTRADTAAKKPLYKLTKKTLTTAPKNRSVIPPKIKPSLKPKLSQPAIADKAIALANEGKLEEALTICEEGFKLEPTNPINYFTYGLTLVELNKMDAAETALKKTLFLDNKFAVGHFQLGLLLLRKKQITSGLKHLHNAIKIAETKSPDEIVIGTPGMSYQIFAEVLRNEINLYLNTGDL